MSIKKKYFPDKGFCQVKFQLPKALTIYTAKAFVVGEFKDFNWVYLPMKRGKNGAFSVKVELPIGNEYQFRYQIDDTLWENDNDADKQVHSPFGDSQNSVVVIKEK